VTEADQVHFVKVFGDRVKAVEGAVISDDEMAFRRLLSLNSGNYVGKATRAIMAVLGITRAANIGDLFRQFKDRSGRVLASESLRVRVISDRIVASAQEFIGAEAWDGEVEGKHVRIQWRDRRDRDYRLTELPVPGKRRLRVRSGGFSNMASHHGRFLLMVNVIGKIMFGGVTYDQACDLIDKEMKKLVDAANAEAEKALDYKDLIDGPWETQVFYLEVEPHGTKGFTAEGKDFKLEVGWNEFKGYDSASDFQQADPHYTMYKSKSAMAARKMYKILRADPDALKQVAWGAFGDWMRRNGIAYDIQFSQWH
jgi:hypothetical protein